MLVALHATRTVAVQVSPAPTPTPLPTTATLSCEESLRPDLVVIEGGLSAKSVSPRDGSTQIEREVAAIRELATSKGGTLSVLERLRAARNVKPGNDSSESKAPFQQIQHIELQLPSSVDVDEVLERMFKLGLDRYGTDLRFGRYDSSDFHGLTRYRYKALDVRLNALRKRCIETTAKKACGEKVDVCLTRPHLTATLKTSSFTDRNGSQQERYISLPEGEIAADLPDLKNFEPAGDVPIVFHYSGTIGFGQP